MANQNRASELRKFLVATFGLERLQSGSGVLDVAGGKGELAFQLQNLNGIPATVVDPRPMQLKSFRARLVRLTRILYTPVRCHAPC